MRVNAQSEPTVHDRLFRPRSRRSLAERQHNNSRAVVCQCISKLMPETKQGRSANGRVEELARPYRREFHSRPTTRDLCKLYTYVEKCELGAIWRFDAHHFLSTIWAGRIKTEN